MLEARSSLRRIARPKSFAVVAAVVLGAACQDEPRSVGTEGNQAALAPGAYVWQAEAIAPPSAGQPTSANLQNPPGVGIISHVNNGGFAKYAAVPFGAAGTYKRFVARLATPYWENRVKVHLDSLDGPVIANLGTWSTGTNWGTFTEQSAPLLQDVSGTHDVWLEFDGSTNYAACQQYCWVTPVKPECSGVVTEGCGFGVGNFDWFALAPLEGTQIDLALTPATPVAGQPFTMKVIVTSTSGVPTPDGSVSINGGGTSAISNAATGSASFGGTQPAGTYNYTISYQGTGYLPSSKTFTVVVAPAP